MTLARIEKTFETLKQQGRAGLVTYTMAFDPSRKVSEQILAQLPEAGADIIELGMPFSDPMADGPAIQVAGKRALKAGAKLKTILEIVATFRQNNQHTPVVLMGYYNPIQHYGIDAFVKDAANAGADGLLIVDLPPEEDGLVFDACKAESLALIKLLTPTTDEKRLKTVLPHASGFLYYVTVAGVTGTSSATKESIAAAVKRFKDHTDLPIVAGFGIKTPDAVAELKDTADALVVGSAIVAQITEAHSAENAVPKVLGLVSSLAKAIA